MSFIRFLIPGGISVSRILFLCRIIVDSSSLWSKSSVYKSGHSRRGVISITSHELFRIVNDFSSLHLAKGDRSISVNALYSYSIIMLDVGKQT